MTDQEKEPKPTKGAFDFVDLITGRIGKITGLVGAVGALLVLVLTQYEQVLGKLTGLHLYTPRPCVEIEPLVIPATVQYRDWDNMKMKLKGRNNCGAPLGLYVAFVRRTDSEPRFILRAPGEDSPACKKGPSAHVPDCWDMSKPVGHGKGNWELDVKPPPLTPLSDPRRIERISISWFVYDLDAPTQVLYGTGPVTIEVHNDAGNPS